MHEHVCCCHSLEERFSGYVLRDYKQPINAIQLYTGAIVFPETKVRGMSATLVINKQTKMAAKDKESMQQFPLVKNALLNDRELHEHLKLMENVKDGQQSVGQSEQDPYTRAVKYLEHHRILEVFQVRRAINRDRLGVCWRYN